MCQRIFAFAAAAVLMASAVGAQTAPPTKGPAANGSPAWFLQGSYPDPTGHTIVDASGHVTVPPRMRPDPLASNDGIPPCSHSPVCGRRDGFPRAQLQRVEWQQMPGYSFTYPYVLPP